MIYLYAYLGIGVAVLIVVYAAHRLSASDETGDLADLLAAGRPPPTRWEILLEKGLVPALAILLVIAAWPLALYWKAKESVDARRSAAQGPAEPEFALTAAHLLKAMTVAEIETENLISDPLDAVPRLPFGHLNPAWQAFRESIPEDGRLWSFLAVWSPAWGGEEVREGYAVVRGEAIGPHFLARVAEVEADVLQGAS